MSERDVTMSTCPHCDQPVQPSLHTTVQCLSNMRNQRDEAREAAETYHEAWQDAAVYWKASRDEARHWARNAWQMVSCAERKQMFDPPPDWLEQQASVDE